MNRAVASTLVTAGLAAGCMGQVGDEFENGGAGPLHTGDGKPPTSVTHNPTPGNRAPQIVNPGNLRLSENQPFELRLPTHDADGGAVRVFVKGLPPGAVWSEAERKLSFQPDFIQGGQSWDVEAAATDGKSETRVGFSVSIDDTIRSPEPTVVARERLPSGAERLTVEQRTDAFLDSPEKAGRVVRSIVTIPPGASAESRIPVSIFLHGFAQTPSAEGTEPALDAIRIVPHDPDNSYWWGYRDNASGTVQPYTARKVLAMLEWVLKTQPGADAERVNVEGGSMGGAGAVSIGLLNGRHFAHVRMNDGQTIPLNHRPSRTAQLSTLWGSPQEMVAGEQGRSAWAEQDATRALRESPEARNQFIATKNSKDDPTVHFGAVSQRSPLTGSSFYETLESERIGHYAVWDEGAHGPPDPVLGHGWWDNQWNRSSDGSSFLRRDLAFPAFTSSDANDNPGTGEGNGRVLFNAESGFANKLAVPGDTGWNGDIAGALNRGLRWDSNRIVDEQNRFEIPLRVLEGNGQAAPLPGYPAVGDRLDKPTTVVTDVTIRRVQAFATMPGENVRWRYGGMEGIAQAAADGSVTIPDVAVGTDWQTLSLERA